MGAFKEISIIMSETGMSEEEATAKFIEERELANDNITKIAVKGSTR